MTVKECYEEMGGNYEEVISRLRTDERVLRFLGKVREDGSFALLGASLASGDMAEAFRAAHTLKGVCMNLALTRLFDSANAITEALRGRETYGNDLEPLYDTLKHDYECTMESIGKLS